MEPRDGVCIVTRRDFAGKYLPDIDDYKVRAARMLATCDDVEDARRPDSQAGLLQALPFGGAGRILTAIDKARRQGPRAPERFVDPPDKQDLIILLKEDRRGHFGVVEIDPSTIGTNRPLVTELLTRGKGGCTARTEPYLGGIHD